MYQNKRILRDKGLIIMSIVSLLAVIGLIVGIMMADNNNTETPSNIAELAESPTTVSTKKADSKVSKETESTTITVTEEIATTKNITVENVTEEIITEEIITDNASVNAPASSLSFTQSDILLWPVETNDIIIDFSMDTTTYFSTLDMYKTSDAVCIRSAVDSPVYASADGVITNNSYNEEIGHFIVMDLGNEYELTYGQLKNMQVDEGDTIKKGDLIGYISEPTKYYTVEGANLYLKLTEKGVPTDPLDYLDFE